MVDIADPQNTVDNADDDIALDEMPDGKIGFKGQRSSVQVVTLVAQGGIGTRVEEPKPRAATVKFTPPLSPPPSLPFPSPRMKILPTKSLLLSRITPTALQSHHSPI